MQHVPQRFNGTAAEGVDRRACLVDGTVAGGQKLLADGAGGYVAECRAADQPELLHHPVVQLACEAAPVLEDHRRRPAGPVLADLAQRGDEQTAYEAVRSTSPG
ncbi:hypothetical protein [Nocardioides sp. URHA0032]|uniref:hypothetical protein n=1 Tax=Nocardioides sp. URHA0032 TaxID=1380388 RepID=UPI0004919CE8|nr:hypothetical protein [Nocardioides sp. URHA0032]